MTSTTSTPLLRTRRKAPATVLPRKGSLIPVVVTLALALHPSPTTLASSTTSASSPPDTASLTVLHASTLIPAASGGPFTLCLTSRRTPKLATTLTHSSRLE